MKTVNFALIGCGRIAKRHSELLGHGQIPDSRLAAVCDIKPERARAIGEQFGVPHFAGVHEMMLGRRYTAGERTTITVGHSVH